MKFDSDVEYQSKYATSSELSDIELTAGEWEIRVSSKSISLYLVSVSLHPFLHMLCLSKFIRRKEWVFA